MTENSVLIINMSLQTSSIKNCLPARRFQGGVTLMKLAAAGLPARLLNMLDDREACGAGIVEAQTDELSAAGCLQSIGNHFTRLLRKLKKSPSVS